MPIFYIIPDVCVYIQRYQVPNPFLSKTINPPNQPNFMQMSIGKRVEVQPQCMSFNHVAIGRKKHDK